MKNTYKPEGYNSASPYFVLEDAPKFIRFLQLVFDAEQLRRYDMPDGTIMHAEVRIDDSVLMMGNSSDQFPANKLMTHVYVADADEVFRKAIEAGCQSIEEPKVREGDPDRRGSFVDFAGNFWSVGTQQNK